MAYRINPIPTEEVSNIDPRIVQRQAQLEAQRAAAAKGSSGSSWNPSGRTGGTTSTGDVRVWKQPENVYTPPAAPSGGGGYKSGGGSSGGGGGNTYTATAVAAPSYAEIPEYNSKYAEQIEALAKQILGRKFSYNPFDDPMYKNYEKQYTRMGERALEDVMGMLSGKTGGMASSYATSAAQQANNAYLAELSGIIPELQQAAYEMFLNEGNSMIDNLNSLISRDNIDYSRYRDTVNDINEHNNALAKQYTSTSKNSTSGSSIENSLNFLVDSGAIDADTAASIYLGNIGGSSYAAEDKKKKLGNGGR